MHSMCSVRSTCALRWARMALVYFLMSVLVAMLGLIVVRYAVFTLVWVVTGHALWLLPNMMSDQVRCQQPLCA